MELDIGDLALAIDERVGVHAKTLHVAVVGRDAYVVQQEGELQRNTCNQSSLDKLELLTQIGAGARASAQAGEMLSHHVH